MKRRRKPVAAFDIIHEFSCTGREGRQGSSLFSRRRADHEEQSIVDEIMAYGINAALVESRVFQVEALHVPRKEF